MVRATAVNSLTVHDLAVLRAAVKARSSRLLSVHDIDDVVGEILVESVAASKRSGIPVVKLAFTNAKRRKFYTRAVNRVTAANEMLSLDVERARESGDSSHYERQIDPTDLAAEVELRDLLWRLPRDQWAAFFLCRVMSFTIAEASVLTGMSATTLHRNLWRAQRSLAAEFASV